MSKCIKKPDNQRLPYVSIDPGIKTFATIFSPEIIGKVGQGDFSRRVLKCDGCGTVIDRDINGARGILLRALVVTPFRS